MESIQLSQVLADLSNLGAAEPEAAAAIVSANVPSRSSHARPEAPTSAGSAAAANPRRPSGLQRHWSSETKFDKFGRRILINSPGSHTGSAGNSCPGTPRRAESDVRRSPRQGMDTVADKTTTQFEDDVDRASTLIALYDIRSKIKQQDNSSLLRAREKINALAARQQAQQAAERNIKAADDLRRQRYTFPRAGL
ncbi:hypothetical protein FZEAL_10585 [Fusarium zealandicum]|uniref:Uncharacterized protein n=1 Tax=Fusarium zealandicum TaxID=1053134 RepID=A0A8H4TZQ3_9HYPO|nr:hypothetical protein FZEAL_10585 [Fusarium zealandicum]